ncbi:MAG: ArsA-related P-loop ATPase [Motiliproteus sp.]
MTAEPAMIFVTGKGGTGKSTIAAALALQQARQGKRVQLIELASHSFFSAVEAGADETQQGSLDAADPTSLVTILEGVELFRLDPMASLKQYIKRFTLFEAAAKLLLDSKPARGVLNTLPGLKELAIVGKLTHCLEQNQSSVNSYDITVVDCFSTGHFLALLRAPNALAQSIRSGPMGQQCRKMMRQLSDPTLCRYLIVTLPEELPLAESLELSVTLTNELDINADFICNKTLPSDIAEVEEAAETAGDSFSNYLNDWQQRQTRVLDELSQHSGKAAVAELPFCFEVDLSRQVDVLAQVLESADSLNLVTGVVDD